MKRKIPRNHYNRLLETTHAGYTGSLTIHASYAFLSEEWAEQVGNLWDDLKHIEILWEEGSDAYTEDMFTGLWEDASQLGFVAADRMPEVWRYFPVTWVEPEYNEPIEEGCEEVMKTIRCAIVEAIYEAEDA